MKIRNSLYVAGSRQHVGLKDLFDNIGYIKPVGQHSVIVDRDDDDEESNEYNNNLSFETKSKHSTSSLSSSVTKPQDMKRKSKIAVDKDVPLFKEVLKCTGKYSWMSPVLFQKDYTKEFLNGKILFREQEKRIIDGFNKVKENSAFVVVEGTDIQMMMSSSVGHSGVGSLCGISNAKVASMINTPMILIVNGGIGSAYDDLELNRFLCEAQGASIACVIMNKVLPSKLEESSYYLTKALQRWPVPLVGVIPDMSSLDSPAVMDFERKLGMKLIGGNMEKHGVRHFAKTELISTDATKFIKSATEFSDKTLFVMDASRTDLILSFLTFTQMYANEKGRPYGGGLLLAGKLDDIVPQIRSRYLENADVPILFANGGVLEVIHRMQRYAHKLSAQDPERTLAVANHYKRHINFAALLDAINPGF